VTDLGVTIDPGPAAAGGEPTFAALIAFVTRFTGLMRRLLADLTRVTGLDPEFDDAIRNVIRQRTIEEYARTIIEAVEGLEGDARASLVSHGLADGSADMRLKMAAFDAAVRASKYVETADGEFGHRSSEAGQRESQVLDVLASAGSALTVANSILKSASHAIPVAGAYSEIKDSAEAGISLLRKGIRAVRGLRRRFRRAGRSEPQPAAAEE